MEKKPLNSHFFQEQICQICQICKSGFCLRCSPAFCFCISRIFSTMRFGWFPKHAMAARPARRSVFWLIWMNFKRGRRSTESNTLTIPWGLRCISNQVCLLHCQCNPPLPSIGLQPHLHSLPQSQQLKTVPCDSLPCWGSNFPCRPQHHPPQFLCVARICDADCFLFVPAKKKFVISIQKQRSSVLKGSPTRTVNRKSNFQPPALNTDAEG